MNRPFPPLSARAALPCVADPAPWLAETTEDQAYAARLCGPCPIIRACRERGRTGTQGAPEWGVWGGETTAERAAVTGRTLPH